MELNEKQLEMCTTSRWISRICGPKAIFEKNRVQVDEVRVVDHHIAFGVWGDRPGLLDTWVDSD